MTKRKKKADKLYFDAQTGELTDTPPPPQNGEPIVIDQLNQDGHF